MRSWVWLLLLVTDCVPELENTIGQKRNYSARVAWIAPAERYVRQCTERAGMSGV